MIHRTKVVGILKGKEETEAMAALNRLNVDMLNEVLTIFPRFVKSGEGNSVTYFEIFPMLQKLMADLGSLCANEHAETFTKAVSEGLSHPTDLNIIFTCFLVTPDGKRYSSDVPRPGVFVASMEAIWNRGVAALAAAFSYSVAHMTDLFQNYLDHPRQFGSLMDLCATYPRSVSIAGQQLDTGPFVDLLKRIEAFPATECACERFFCQLRNLVSGFRHQMCDSMIVDLLVIKTGIIWPNGTHIKECSDILRRASKVQSDAEPDQQDM
jgi:hypothetical protein